MWQHRFLPHSWSSRCQLAWGRWTSTLRCCPVGWPGLLPVPGRKGECQRATSAPRTARGRHLRKNVKISHQGPSLSFFFFFYWVGSWKTECSFIVQRPVLLLHFCFGVRHLVKSYLLHFDGTNRENATRCLVRRWIPLEPENTLVYCSILPGSCPMNLPGSPHQHCHHSLTLWCG